MNSISVLIPTRNRSKLLAQALESVMCQTILPAEIVVGDDSDDVSENIAIIKSFVGSNPSVPEVRHLTIPTGSQAANVDRLIRNCTKDWLCLLHDDDLLFPNALEVMLGAAASHRKQTGRTPVLVYGMQAIINDDGTEDRAESDAFNLRYFRAQENSMFVENNSFLAALYQQAPNDGFLVARRVATEIGYQRYPPFGDACDFAFPIELSRYGEFCFIPEFTMKYRLSTNSVLRGVGGSSNRTSIDAFLLTKELLAIRPEFSDQIDCALRQRVKTAVYQAIMMDNIEMAFTLFFSKVHLSSILSAGFFRRGGLLVLMMIRHGIKK